MDGAIFAGKTIKKPTGTEMLVFMSNTDCVSLPDNSTVKSMPGILAFEGDDFSYATSPAGVSIKVFFEISIVGNSVAVVVGAGTGVVEVTTQAEITSVVRMIINLTVFI